MVKENSHIQDKSRLISFDPSTFWVWMGGVLPGLRPSESWIWAALGGPPWTLTYLVWWAGRSLTARCVTCELGIAGTPEERSRATCRMLREEVKGHVGC